MDELFEALTWRQLGLHEKPIFVVNTEGYWTPFMQLLEHVVARGFADESLLEYVQVVPDAAATLAALEAHFG